MPEEHPALLQLRDRNSRNASVWRKASRARSELFPIFVVRRCSRVRAVGCFAL